jgi:hypothetical protein
MAGGRFILVATGDAQDKYFHNNPEITYFKTVFHRYTRFSVETKTQEFDNTSLNVETVLKQKLKIQRNGDLLKSMYLTFDLPDIYSGKYTTSNFYFKWIRNIGHYIIKDVRFSIGTLPIQTLCGEWLDIWKELHLPEEEKKGYDNMTGNTPDMHSPEKADGNNGFLTVSINNTDYFVNTEEYPNAKTRTSTATAWEDISPINNLTSGEVGDNTYPSIRGRTIKVPLDFWFQKYAAYALPLIALQKQDCYIELTLRPLKDLYTSVNPITVTTPSTINKRIKYSTAFLNNGIQYFVGENRTESIINIEGTGSSKTLLNSKFPINLKLETNYIFLENEERRRFAEETHEYLVETIKKVSATSISSSTKNIETYSNHHVKEIIFVPKRSDAANVNEWDNFTNWIQKDIDPRGIQFWKSVKSHVPYFDTTASKFPFPSRDYSVTTFTRDYIKKNIIKDITIKLNNVPLFNKQDYLYYEAQQPLEYHRNNVKDGVYVYSFSLNPNVKAPSGSINMAGQKINFDFTFQSLPVNADFGAGNEQDYVADYTYDIDIYIVQYNILKIQNGVGGLVFS